MSKANVPVNVRPDLRESLLTEFEKRYKTPGNKRARTGELIVHWQNRIDPDRPPSDQAVLNLLKGKSNTSKLWLVDGLCRLLLGCSYAEWDNQFAREQYAQPKSPDIFETSSQPIPPNPYRGLYAFGEKDAEFFFGRDTFIEQLLAAVRKKPLVPLIGRSGSGKSSVVFAGLIPKLKKEGSWLIADFRPEGRPFYNLAKKLNPLLTPQWETIGDNDKRREDRNLANNLKQGVDTLQDVIADILENNPSEHRFLLVIDQFEELYTISPEDARLPFINQLLASVRVASAKLVPNFTLVLTLRDDFLGDALESPLGKALQEFKTEFLYAMTREQLQEVIEKPAEKQKVKIEECLTDRILDAVVGSPGILPCLEFALTQLWEKQKNNLLDFSAYKEIGGVEKALANHADSVFEKLNETDQKRVKIIFLQLVNFEKKKQDTRRMATRTEVGKDNWNLVKKLADARLVVTGREEEKKEETVEIVHEALIRGWDRLHQWMEEDRDFRTWQERLRAAMERWEAINRDEGGLLQKALLVEAEDWVGKRDSEITPDEKVFIKKSRDYEDGGRKLQEELLLKSQISEINTLVSLSESRLAQHDRLGALLEAVNAGNELRSLISAAKDATLEPSIELKERAIYGLRQALNCIQELNRWEGHTGGRILWVTFSPDGQIIASASTDKTVKLWRLDGTLLGTLSGHQDSVAGVTFSPDGQTIASASADKTVKLWQLDGTLLGTLSGHSEMVNKVSFSPDGQTIASASDDKTVKIWRVNGQIIQTLARHDEMVYGLAFSPDGKTLASCSLDRTINLWNLDSYNLIKTLKGHSDVVTDVNFSPDGAMLVSASEDGTIRLWQLNGTEILTIDKHGNSVNSSNFSHDGKLIVSASKDGTVRLWQLDGTTIQIFQGHKNQVTNASFSPDGRVIVSCSTDNTIRLWKRRNDLLQHDTIVRSVSFSPDGQTIASASHHRDVRIWSVNGNLIETFDKHNDVVNNVSFSPDGQIIASASRDATVKLWRVDGRLLHTFEDYCDSNVSFSPDGSKIIFSIGADRPHNQRRIRLCKIDGTILQTFPPSHGDRIWYVSFSPDGQSFASASHDTTVKLWQIDGTLLHTFKGHSRVSCVNFSPDGQTIVSANHNDPKINLWQIDGRLLPAFTHSNSKGHSNKVLYVNFSPDGKMIVSGSDDKTIKIWRLNGELIQTLEGHTDAVESLSFSPNGKIIVSASHDKTIRVWQINDTKISLDLNEQLDDLLLSGCNWLRDYLKANPNASSRGFAGLST